MNWVFLGFFPFVLVAGYIAGRLSASETPLICAILAYGVLLLAYSLRLVLTECPRCQGLYHLNWWSNPWTRRCLNCGLRLKPDST